MRSVGIKVLNSRLSEYVRLAAAGATELATCDRRMSEAARALRIPLFDLPA